MRTSNFIIILIMAVVLISCGEQNGKQGSEVNDDIESLNEFDNLSEKIKQDTLNKELYLERAELYLKKGDANSALADINKALELDPKNANAYVTLSDAYLAMGEMNKCIEALDKAEELDPDNAEGLLRQAEVYLILKDYKLSLRKIRSALQIDSYNPTAYFIRAYTLLEYGDTNSAVRDLITAVEQDQEYFEAYMQLGLLYSEKNDPLAIGYFGNAMKSRPNNPEPYYFLGMFYQNNEDLLRAVEVYNNLLAVDPEYVDAYYNLGYIYLVYLEEYELAIGYFTNVIDRHPKHFDAFHNRGYAYELSGDYKKARADYQKTLDIFPNYELAIKSMNRLDEIERGM